eukprot:201872-Chlamydomonas_euryale.AAC.7
MGEGVNQNAPAQALLSCALEDHLSAPGHPTSQSQSQSYRERTHEGYACVERSEVEGINQRAGRCHKGHAIVQGPEPPPTNPTPPSSETPKHSLGSVVKCLPCMLLLQRIVRRVISLHVGQIAPHVHDNASCKSLQVRQLDAL